ncbi:MAG: sodium:proton antiporter [Methylobacter sp.]|nr:sodium:proton antiporter [Methylobacter sp.]
MSFAIWALIIGALLIIAALSGTLLKRLPLSTAMVYLAAGYGLGPAGLGLMEPNPLTYSVLLERMAEAAVLISLFAVGLKLGIPLSHKAWRLPVRLAVISMALTVALIAVIGILGFNLPLGAAILLGAILAPTDPVLASDVQVEEATDHDRLRISLTGEGGLNDSSAFPFVMLGLGILGLHDLGTGGWRWLLLDVLWATAGGLLIGSVTGSLIGKLVIYMRSQHKESVGLDEFLTLGLIAFTYGVAVLSYTYGFLAVFAAGFSLQRITQQPRKNNPSAPSPIEISDLPSKQVQEDLATHSEYAGIYMMHEMQGFNARLERIAEVAIVLVVGAMLPFIAIPAGAVWFLAVFFLIIRPVSVWIGLRGESVSRNQQILMSWFGIRGIGSIYYLMYSINHGLSPALASQITSLTITTVTASIILHGISVTPLMNLYAQRNAP